MSNGAGSDRLFEDAEPPEFVRALGDELARRERAELPERIAKSRPEIRRGLLPVPMCAAHRLRHDAVDDAQALQLRRRDTHELRRFRRLRGLAPQDGRTAFGRDDGVDAVLEHEDPAAHPDGKRAPAPALPRDHADDGRGEPRHLAKVARDGFGLAPLLRPQAGIGAGSVDEGQDGLPELRPELHEAQGLAIAFRVRHAEVPRDVLAGVAALLVAEGDHGLPLEAAEPAHDGLVVAEDAIAVELDEVVEEEAEEVEGVRTLRVTGELRALPRGHVAIEPPLR